MYFVSVLWCVVPSRNDFTEASRETSNIGDAGKRIKVGDVVEHYCRPGLSPVDGPEYEKMFMECTEISDYSTNKRTTFMNTTLPECVGELTAGAG